MPPCMAYIHPAQSPHQIRFLKTFQLAAGAQLLDMLGETGDGDQRVLLFAQCGETVGRDKDTPFLEAVFISETSRAHERRR